MHYTTRRFWECYNALPEAVQRIADQWYELLKASPTHPSLHFKKVVNIGQREWDEIIEHWV
jgi:hypothetical protein